MCTQFQLICRLEALYHLTSQEPLPNQTLLIIVQSRETETSRSVPSSVYPEQTKLYIQAYSIPADSRDFDL